MKRLTPFLLFAVLLPLFFFACKDDPSLTDPSAVVDPSMGLYDGSQDASAQRITQLIIGLYPNPDPENAALNRWGNVQRLMAQGRMDPAQSQMRTLADQVVRFSNEGALEDPPTESDLPPTTEGAVRELVTRLYIFVGLGAAEALESFPDDMPEDYGSGVFEPGAEEETVITTGNNWAAVVAPAGAVAEGDDPVFVNIELVNQEICENGGLLLQANGCWNITRFPQGQFEDEVTVEVCVADNPDLTDEQWELLLLHKRDEGGNVTVLPWAEPETIDCQGFTIPAQTVSLSPASALLASLGGHLADLLLPDPLGAALQTRPSSRRLGGLTGSFSDFFGAVPEGALPNLTNWWSGDGDFLDWYGYHGVSSPPGAVSFTTGVSNEAFDLDRGEVVSEAVVIPSIPDRVNDAQQLTLATWVNLDPEGPADDIQRFVTLSKEKAVLRQEGWPGVSNRMLHFYMHFAPFNEEEFNLEAIRVDNAFQTGCYQFFVGTYDGDWMRAYVDGEQVGERNVPGGVVMDTYGWAELGSEGTEGLQGSLDEVMIFDRALTPDEIQEIYDYVPAGDKCGPTYTVQGTVFYSTNELGGVTVDLGQGPVTEPTWLRTTVTDETGVYEFDFVPPGDYWVKVYGADYGAPGEYIGWKSSSLTVVDGDVVRNMDLPKIIQLTSPANLSTVSTLHPTLTWVANPEAQAAGDYVVQVNVTDTWALVEQVGSATNSYTIATELSLGETYTWQVDGYDGAGHHVGTTNQAFQFTVDPATLVIDGIIGQGEWDAADSYGPITVDLGGEATTTATVLATNNDTDLFIAVVFDQDLEQSVDGQTLAIRLDDDNDSDWNIGPDERGDDGWVIQHLANGQRIDALFDDHFSDAVDPPQGQSDTSWQGTNDGSFAIVNDGQTTVIEMSHPLSSGDARDAELSAGDPYGLLIFTNIWPAGGGDRIRTDLVPVEGGFAPRTVY